MHIYNPLPRHKDEFTPQRPGEVSLYVCGITAYDFCHIGHARAAVVFDVFVCYLPYRVYHLLYFKVYLVVPEVVYSFNFFLKLISCYYFSTL